MHFSPVLELALLPVDAMWHCDAPTPIQPSRRHADVASAPASQLEPTSHLPESPARSGPGWFDSSFDLRNGLEVHDGWPEDAGFGELIGWS